jgi:hypothetical protein|tara:strand:- start:398 stop:622 length:225 start_codon:yes stop_codon:yes gene_type:complete
MDTVYTRTHNDGRIEKQIYSDDPGICLPPWSIDAEATKTLQKPSSPVKKTRSRKKSGKFVADDPSTPNVNEAFK